MTPRHHTQFQKHHEDFHHEPASQSSLDSSKFCMSSNTCTEILTSSSKRENTRRTITIKKKRLIRHSEIEQNTCSICLEYIRERAELSCKHPFCVSCLKEWLNTSSTCPYCRADCPFYLYGGQQYLIEQRAFRFEGDFPDWPDSEEEDDGLDYECYMCERTQQGDTVLICDRCLVHSCHPECDPRIRKPLREDEEWYCHFCS